MHGQRHRRSTPTGFTIGELVVSLVVIPLALYLWLPSLPIRLDAAPDDPGPMTIEYFRLDYASARVPSEVVSDVRSALESCTSCPHLEMYEFVARTNAEGVYYVGVWCPSASSPDLAHLLRTSLDDPPMELRRIRVASLPQASS